MCVSFSFFFRPLWINSCHTLRLPHEARDKNVTGTIFFKNSEYLKDLLCQHLGFLFYLTWSEILIIVMQCFNDSVILNVQMYCHCMLVPHIFHYHRAMKPMWASSTRSSLNRLQSIRQTTANWARVPIRFSWSVSVKHIVSRTWQKTAGGKKCLILSVEIQSL